MNKYQWLLLFCIHLVLTIVILSPFLPGPGTLSTITNNIYTFFQFSSLFLLIAIPVGIIATIHQINQKKNISLLFILLWTLPATSFSVTLWGADAARNFSRKVAIKNATPIIQAIEVYYQVYKKYPDQLSDLTLEYLPKIPKTGIMGIATYQYEKRDSSFAVMFTQNVLAGFNKEIVSYDPRYRYSSDDAANQIYPAGKDNWQYYILD